MKSQIEKTSRRIKELFETDIVKVIVSQGSIFFTIFGNSKEDRKKMLAVKAQAIGYILDNEKRPWSHSKVNGYRVWWYGNRARNVGLRCGIKTKLTDEERKAVILGPEAWYGIQEK